MKRIARHRFVTGLLLVAMATSILAPAAEAKNRRWKIKDRGYDRVVHVERRVRSHPVRRHRYSEYSVRRSNAGPVIAGFIGGLFLGATIANAAPAGYQYYDPYCHQNFATLTVYHSHLRSHRHPQVVRVVDYDRGYDDRNDRDHSYDRRGSDDCDDDHGRGRDDDRDWDDDRDGYRR